MVVDKVGRSQAGVCYGSGLRKPGYGEGRGALAGSQASGLRFTVQVRTMAQSVERMRILRSALPTSKGENMGAIDKWAITPNMELVYIERHGGYFHYYDETGNEQVMPKGGVQTFLYKEDGLVELVKILKQKMKENRNENHGLAQTI